MLRFATNSAGDITVELDAVGLQALTLAVDLQTDAAAGDEFAIADDQGRTLTVRRVADPRPSRTLRTIERILGTPVTQDGVTQLAQQRRRRAQHRRPQPGRSSHLQLVR